MEHQNDDGKTNEILRICSHVDPTNQEIIHISLDQLTFAKSDLHFHVCYTCFENDRPPFCSHSNFIFADVYTSPAGSTFFLENQAPAAELPSPAL